MGIKSQKCMPTSLEKSMELERLVRQEVKARFPSLDHDWAVNYYFNRMHTESRKIASALMCMMPEVLRSQTGEKQDG